jgi:hypothetical protein
LVSIDVAGFPVAVEDAVTVSLSQCFGNLDSVRQDRIRGRRSARAADCQQLAFEELHHQVVQAVLRPTSWSVQMSGGFQLEMA